MQQCCSRISKTVKPFTQAVFTRVAASTNLFGPSTADLRSPSRVEPHSAIMTVSKRWGRRAELLSAAAVPEVSSVPLPKKFQAQLPSASAAMPVPGTMGTRDGSELAEWGTMGTYSRDQTEEEDKQTEEQENVQELWFTRTTLYDMYTLQQRCGFDDDDDDEQTERHGKGGVTYMMRTLYPQHDYLDKDLYSATTDYLRQLYTTLVRKFKTKDDDALQVLAERGLLSVETADKEVQTGPEIAPDWYDLSGSEHEGQSSLPDAHHMQMPSQSYYHEVSAGAGASEGVCSGSRSLLVLPPGRHPGTWCVGVGRSW